MRTPLDPQRLTRKRIGKGLSQKELGERSGVSRQLICMVEKGTANFSPRYLAKIAAALECQIEDLLPEDDATFHALSRGPAE
ncbi:helix-turn-helix transcriptional regulator [Streptomyces sp. NPDC026665]|uniref:helix-turn-helix transcriptional regulator n=1 Tax=Streptomyces sp. NPDC026665 TaxID=3154798 RepID=UPI0033E03F11